MGQGQTLFGRRKDGTEFPLEIGLNRLDGDDDPVVLCAIVDMTERERAKADLEERTRDLERSNTELQQFAYVASHDLQEPLRMVASFCELLKERYADKLDDDGVEFIEFAVDGARRMKQLISSLLEYSRVQTRDVAFTAVPAEDTLNEAMFNLTALIEEREADIQWASLPLVRGHKGQLVHLFQNLIGNALKFCDSDRPKVRVFAHQDGGKWVISVTDNGIGIDPEHTEKIFGVFQRLHTRDEYPGSGMGLAICKRIVEVHGGTIWAESSPGRGTTIRFTLTPPDEELADLMRATPTRDHFYYVNQESTDVRSTG
jgi:light-regulated signal transduction histidine kinase (bacteriophytochrome)